MEYDLPEILASILLMEEQEEEFMGQTILDDFYDFVEVAPEYRSDYGSAALMDQALYLINHAK